VEEAFTPYSALARATVPGGVGRAGQRRKREKRTAQYDKWLTTRMQAERRTQQEGFGVATRYP